MSEVNLSNLNRNSNIKKIKTILSSYSKELMDYLSKPKIQEELKLGLLGIIDLLEMYNLNITPLELIEICPRIQSRHYTISSSPCSSKNLEIILKVETKENKDKLWTGLFSDFILEKFKNANSNQNLNIPICCLVVESTFNIPADPKNLLMIATGTGVAPFLGVLANKIKFPNSYKELSLVLGLRNDTEDMWPEKIMPIKENKVISHLYLALSRTGVL